MTSDRWNEVERLYHAALEREPHKRAAFLAQCQDEEVRREVQSLLNHEQSGDRLLDNVMQFFNLEQSDNQPVATSVFIDVKWAVV